MRRYVLSLLLILLCNALAGISDLAEDRAALLALRSAVGGRLLLWNTSEQSPCQWNGVGCESDRVVFLRLPAMGLSGQLPANVFGNLTQLQTLSLRFNALTGQLPQDLGQLDELRNLYLQGNKFSGEIPSFLFGLGNLVRLNLAGNKFSGEISTDFNKLTRLGTLYLEENQLSGTIPDLSTLNLTQFNVSYNDLSGSIPSKLSTFPPSAFEGNSLCGSPLSPCAGESKNGLSGGAIAGIVIGCAVGVLLLLLILFYCKKSRKSEKSRSTDVAPAKQMDVETPSDKTMDTESHSVGAAAAAGAAASGKTEVGPNKKLVFFRNSAQVFDLEDLLRASAEVLGKGTFGTAYKAVLEVGMTVAVKRLKDVNVNEKEFREKIVAVGEMDHENLVPLRAYYYSRDEKLLVHDYMPMGSLSALLHGNRGAGRTPLNWETRSGIALGAARGIAYIHAKGPTSSHGNIKSSNVLLSKNYEARVSDFGLAHLVGPTLTPNRVAGYRAPEVTDARKVSQKADIYSFGVLLLELLTGKAPTHALLNEEGVDLPRWVQSVVREEWTVEVFDIELLRYQNVEEEMVQLLQLAIDCTAQYPDHRPSITEVTARIEELCHSGLQKEQDPVSIDAVDGSSERTYSVDSGAPPPSSG
ncbi:Leucine-rich repeat-containing N-terminal, plant-type [Dillenia turbinata]|uniref:Leucine-rich repeat-containing N-terminal, plant-type n=1 Tax=Dillenia turbinata TaxID=194707 RepID=A0AAN8V5G1_9MAGN